MKTSEFIAKCARGEQTREKSVASVWFNGKHLFSYGSHYPLLIKVGNAWIVNQTGYSNITAKHIGWAGMFADYKIEIPNDKASAYRGLADDVRELKDVALKNLTDAKDQLSSLKRQNTKKADAIRTRIDEFTRTAGFLVGQVLDQYSILMNN